MAAVASAFSINAQVTDTVSTGLGYANEVYYSLENDEVKTIERNNWDLAFDAGGYGSSILTNGANGVELYLYQNGDTSNWDNIDTAGLSTWPILYNADSTWSEGAVTRRGADYAGWGNYSFITHHVIADSLFIIKTSNGDFKKLWVDRLASGSYYFKYDDILGGNEVLDTIVKSNYTGKNFGYYSIDADQEVDREPTSESWDIVFTKFVTNSINYGVTGILANNGVEIMKVSGLSTIDATEQDGVYSTNISTIGWDWKSYDYMSGTYTIEEDLTFFVKTAQGDVWKLILTGFGGSANGNYMFSKEKVFSVGTEDVQLSQVATYPNPVSDELNVVFNQTLQEELVINIYSVSGVIVSTQSFQSNSGVNTISFNVSGLASGLYLVNIAGQETSIQTNILVK